MSKGHPTEIKISDIDVSGRSRKKWGDIAGLAASIGRVGLLHPIVVTAANKLIVGRRRVEAYKLLGRATIPANVANDLSGLELLLAAERDENTCREAFTPEEAVHMGERIEALVKPEAKEEQRKAPGGRSQGRKTLPTLKQKESKRTTSQAASASGMSRPTYEKAKAVVATGNRKLIDEMNRTGKVNGVHKKLVVEQKSAAIALDCSAGT